ncbi:MAG: hypothetical protein ACI95C_000911 [Pseudohongiellaceae bacterium]|jgi:hypothetical protein
MEDPKFQAQNQFPTVLLTLISIIQALALELLWNKTIGSEFLYEPSLAALIGWGMISVSLMGVLAIWVMYSTMLIGFTWRPGLRDSILPFVIGIQEFGLIALVSEPFNVMWLYVLASIFLVGNWVSHSTFSRARADAANDLFFRGRSPAGLKDFGFAFITILVLVLLGILNTVLTSSSWVAVLAIVYANIALALQIWNFRQLWDSVMLLQENLRK